jgi:lambda family phage tail tape measure protein
MADLDYTIGVNTNQAERNVDRLKKSIGGLGTTFGTLRNLIGGLAIGGLIVNTVRWADAIQDVSDATNIATANILGFSQAVAESGGTAQDANNAVLRLSETIGNAKEGNKSAIESFAKIGVTLQDLQNLSNEDIFRKVITGLGSISDASRRSAAQVDLLGKGMRGVQLDQVNSRMDTYVERNQSVAGAVKSTADAQERLGQIFEVFKKELITVLQPISNFIAGINSSGESVQRWSRAIITAGAAIALLLAAFSPWGRAIAAVFVSLSGLIRLIGTARGGVLSLGEAFKYLVSGAGRLVQALKTLSKLNLAKTEEFKRILAMARAFQELGMKAKEAVPKLIAVSAVFLSGAAGYFSKELGNIYDKFKKIIGISSDARSALDLEKVPQYDQGGPQGQRRLSQADRAGIIQERFKRENEERQIAIASEKEKINLIQQEINNVRQSGLEHFQNNLLLEDQARIAEKLRNLNADIALLNQVMSTEGAMKQLAAQNELIGLYGREYEYKQELLAIDAERQNSIDQIKQNLITMGDEVQQSDIARAEREIELAQYVADERLKIFQDRVAKEQAIEGSALEGVKAALAELANSVTPFNVAQESTRTLFDGMMNGLEEFATTGKLKFKDFALSLIRDLLLVQIRAQATQMFSGIGGFFASLFAGRAAGGPVTGNTPYVVGEKGPELFVPKSSGTIIPNDKMSGNQSSGGPVTNVYNNYSISAIDSQSVAQFFAQNRKMALGAVTMAQKELSYGS